MLNPTPRIALLNTGCTWNHFLAAGTTYGQIWQFWVEIGHFRGLLGHPRAIFLGAKRFQQTRLWREAYFEFRDEIENCLLSVSCLETRTRFCPPNLEPRDKIENFVHRISGLETRSRILFLKSRNSRRDWDFSIILPKHISKSEKKMFPINAQTLQCN